MIFVSINPVIVNDITTPMMNDIPAITNPKVALIIVNIPITKVNIKFTGNIINKVKSPLAKTKSPNNV